MNREDISLRDIYNAVGDLRKEMLPKFEKLEARLDLLEDFKGKLLGIGIVISVFSGAISNWVWTRITGKSI